MRWVEELFPHAADELAYIQQGLLEKAREDAQKRTRRKFMSGRIKQGMQESPKWKAHLARLKAVNGS